MTAKEPKPVPLAMAKSLPVDVVSLEGRRPRPRVPAPGEVV